MWIRSSRRKQKNINYTLRWSQYSIHYKLFQNQKFFVLFTFYIGLISYHRWIFDRGSNTSRFWISNFFKFVPWCSSLHHLHPRRLEKLYNLQVNSWIIWPLYVHPLEKLLGEMLLQILKHTLCSPPATVVFILFLLFEVSNQYNAE